MRQLNRILTLCMRRRLTWELLCDGGEEFNLVWQVVNAQSKLYNKILSRGVEPGFATKERACKFVGQEGSLGVKENVREWTFTLQRELPLWELESRWTPKCSKSDHKGQNPMNWRVLYTIEKILECRCLKWAFMTHLDIWNTNYGQKKGWESNWQFDSQPLKVKNWPDFLAFRWGETYRWKALDEGYNFALDLISIGGLHAKLWGLKVVGVLTLAISGVLGQNAIWMWASWRGTEYTTRGKVVASPKSGPWWVLWVRICSWFILAPKVLQLCVNHLVFGFGAGMCEWISCLSFFLVPS